MAQWITHLRVAEQIAKTIPPLDNEWFYFGNIAADSGRYVSDHTTFLQLPHYDPPTQITHWSWTLKKRGGSIQPDKFYDAYLKPLGNPFDFTDRKTAFYWGYFSHLLTDILWVEDVIIPVKQRVEEDQQQNPEQAENLARQPGQEWSDIDSLYLEAHPNFAPLQIIRHMAPVYNDLLPYFDDTAMEEKRLECLNHYDTYRPTPNGVLIYTKPTDVDKVITKAAEAFLERLQDKQFQTAHRVIREITDYIFLNDFPQGPGVAGIPASPAGPHLPKSDLIIVLGGSQHRLSEMAALLYHDGLAPLILATGKYSMALGRFAHEKVTEEKYKGNFETECDFIENILRLQGVPAEAIIREDRSMHTMENAAFSAALLKAAGISVKRVILCCKAYHARRALMHFSCHFPGVEFVMIPSETDGPAAHNWYKTEANYRIVLSELKKCGTYFQDYHPQLLC